MELHIKIKMYNVARTVIVLMAILMISVYTKAQQMSPTEVQTPNASGLGRFGDIPVSLYTGTPKISIPLYTMRMGNMELPITLEYDASGVLVNSLPGWTGHNWVLSAGGVITRTRNGACDEYIPTKQSTIAPYTSYFKAYWRLKEDMKNDDVLTSNLMMNRYDYQPDIFTFNFMGKTGRFFLGNDGQWKVYSDCNLDIVFDINNQDNYIYPFIDKYPGDLTTRTVSKVIKGFIIRDDRGFIYEFGGSNDAIDYTLPFFYQSEGETSTSFYASSWYLTKVKDRYGNVLFELEYERGNFIAQFYNNAFSRHIKESYTSSVGHSGQEDFTTNYQFPYDGVLNSPVYLKKISSTHNDWVEFISSPSNLLTEDMYPTLDVFKAFSIDYPGLLFYYLQSDRKDILPYQAENMKPYMSKRTNPLGSTRLNELREISIRNGAKNIKFTYDYNSRMHLTDITEILGYASSSKHYHFNYNSPELLPKDYLSTAVDHWGYYNGTTCNAGDANVLQKRNANASKSLYGVLSDIIYPTGGVSSFTYENNDYSSFVSEDRRNMVQATGVAGGLRIKNITEYSDESKKNILRKRTFSYINPETGKSSGELFAMPKYSWMNYMASLSTKGAIAEQSFSRSTSIVPLSNSFGPHVGYSVVDEIEEDGSYSRYRYKNISGAMDERFIKDFSSGMPSPFDRFTEKGYKRGSVLSIEKYDANNKLMKKVKYGYVSGNVETDEVLTTNLSYVNFGASATFSYFTGGIYKLLFPKYDIVADTTITYYDNGQTEDICSYGKENIILPVNFGYLHQTQVRVLVSETKKREGDVMRKEYKYPFSSGNAATDSIGASQFVLEPISEKTYFNGNLADGFVKNYRFHDGGKPVEDSYMRINDDASKDTVLWFHSYSHEYKPEMFTTLGKAKTRLDWVGPYPYTYEVGIDEIGFNDTKQFFTSQWFDALGNIEEIIFPNGKVFTWYYNSDSQITDWYEDYVVPIRTFRYNYKNK